jgi:hypothetical protein
MEELVNIVKRALQFVIADVLYRIYCEIFYFIRNYKKGINISKC